MRPYVGAKVDKIGHPVLIVHGTDDEVISFSNGLAIFAKLQVSEYLDSAYATRV